MKTTLITTFAAFALSALSAGAYATEIKTTSVESWSVGCTSPAMTTQPGSSPEARAGYDLKTAKGARTAASPPACTSPDSATNPQAVRESPSKASLGRSKELTGHVTLVK